MSKPKPHSGTAPIPSCGPKDQQKILDAIEYMTPRHRSKALDFADGIGLKNLCILLHSMRRWYGQGHNYAVAKRLLGFRDELMEWDAMDLDAPIGVYRGFKVGPKDNLHFFTDLEPGDIVAMPIERNNGASSWTLDRKAANRFSGSTRGKTGIVVKLADDSRNDPPTLKAFLAPPKRSASWFNALYEATMGKAFREKEQEYSLMGKRPIVEIVQVKR